MAVTLNQGRPAESCAPPVPWVSLSFRPDRLPEGVLLTRGLGGEDGSHQASFR